MNKKFSTLIAGVVMLFAAFTVNAQSSITGASDGYVYVTTGTNGYLSISAEKSDSVTVITTSAMASADKATIDKALWKITTVSGGLGTTFKFTNKSTGAVLSLEKKNGANGNLKTGIDNWAITAAGQLYSATAADKVLVINFVDAIGKGISLVEVAATAPVGAGPLDTYPAFKSTSAGSRILTPADLGAGFTVFTLSFGAGYLNNPFDGIELSAVATSDGWVKLQEVGAEEIGKKPAYFGLDSTFQTISAQKNVFGSEFKKDTVYTAGSEMFKDGKVVGLNKVGNDDFQKFMFIQSLNDDKIAVYVKDAPVYSGDPKTLTSWSAIDPNTPVVAGTTAIGKGSVRVVYANVAVSKVLTVSDMENTAAIKQGSVPTVTLGKGTPSKLPNGAGVYYMRTKLANGTYMYLYALNGTDEDQKKDVPVPYLSAGQWVVAEKDGKYAIVDREYNNSLAGFTADGKANYVQIYAVTGSTGVYRIDGFAGEWEFVYQKDITTGGVKYLETKYLTDVEMANMGYTLKMISTTPGVDGLYTFVNSKKELVIKGQTTITDAAKFKVEQAWAGTIYNTTDDNIHDKGVGALALGDTLARASYHLKQQYANSYVYYEGGLPSKLILGNFIRDFVFQSTNQADRYLMMVGGNYVNIDVDGGGNLVVVTPTSNVKTYFNLEELPAPDYANIGNPAHYKVASLEDDGKALSMNPTTLFAEVKMPGQVTKADAYIDSMFGLWIDTASMKDVTRPLYYITTQNTLSSSEKSDSVNYKYFLINPYYQVVSVDEDGYTERNEDSPYFDSKEWGIKAAFAKGVTIGDDTLKLFKSSLKADEDLYYKDMSANPAAIAFATAADGGLKVENTLKAWANTGLDDEGNPNTYMANYYLRVVNNVLYWDNIYWDDAGAHSFSVTKTELFPTDNENVASFAVYAAEGTVTVQGAAGKVVTIVNVLGQTVATKTLASDYDTINAPAGVVFVTVGGETVKAVVK